MATRALRRQDTLLSFASLGASLHDAAELRTLLEEHTITVVEAHRELKSTQSGGGSRSQTPRSRGHTSVADRIKAAVVLDIAPSKLDWSSLVLAVPTEALASGAEDKLSDAHGALQLDLNSGGKVFFLLFSLPPSTSASKAANGRSATPATQPPRNGANAPPTQPRSAPLFCASGTATSSSASGVPPAPPPLGGWGSGGAPSPPREGVAVIKFCGSRLLAQAEQLASEMARHCGVAAPESRVLHQSGPTAQEWEALEAAAAALAAARPPGHAQGHPPAATAGTGASPFASPLGHQDRASHSHPPAAAGHHQHNGGPPAHPHVQASLQYYASQPGMSAQAQAGGLELQEELKRVTAALLMSYVPGSRLACSQPLPTLTEQGWVSMVEDLGRLFVLDLVLGNADRLPCADLGWRGNTGNVLLGASGCREAGRVVGIDACVQRRPPAAKLDREDDAVDRLAQLVLTDPAGQVVVPLLQDQLLSPGPGWLQERIGAGAGSRAKAVAAFQKGMRACLQRVVGLKGLFEMVHARISEWVAEFIADMRQAAPNLQLPSPQKGPLPFPSSALRNASPPQPPSSASSASTGGAAGGANGFVAVRATKSAAFTSPAAAAAAAPTPPSHAPPGSSAYSTPPPRRATADNVATGGGARAAAPPADGERSSGGGGVAGARKGAGMRARAGSDSGNSLVGLAGAPAGGGGGAGPAQPRTAAAAPLAGPRPHRPARAGSTPEPEASGRGVGFNGGEPHGAAGSPGEGAAGLVTPAQLVLKRLHVPPPSSRALSLTRALKVMGQDARENSELSERIDEWRDAFSEHAAALKAAVDEWQTRRGTPPPAGDRSSAQHVMFSLGFLSGAQPIVNLYELKVRLDHMLRRMRVLEEAAAAQAPARVLDDLPLFLGNAVAADSHHVLRYLGISHVLNATEELALPPSSAGFTVLRLPLRDLDDEDITSSFGQASDFIHQALGCPPPVASSSTSSASVPPPAAAPRAGAGAAGGRQGGSPLGRAPSGREGGGAAGVLVHCSQGQSRSVALVAAYLVAKRRMRLATALNLIRQRRPSAAPNPGFSAALIALERSVFGSSSVEGATGEAARAAKDLLEAKKSKPEATRCPVCGIAVGVSTASLKIHMRSKHPDHKTPLLD